MIALFNAVGLLALVLACVFLLKRNWQAATFSSIIAVATALRVLGESSEEPVATITGYASVIIALALLVALVLARLMPKDNTPT